MAKIDFLRGLENNLPSPLNNDAIYITTDTGKLITSGHIWDSNVSSELENITGDLSDLITTDKTNLVASINEVNQKATTAKHYKGLLEYGADTVATMETIPEVSLSNGDLCGVDATQKTYMWDGTSWAEQTASTDQIGDVYDIVRWYGTFLGSTYTGNATATITCNSISPVHYNLIVSESTPVDGITIYTNNGKNSIKPVGTAGVYTKITTSATGQVISGTTLSDVDLPSTSQNANIVHKSGDETIAGTKTFSTSPVVPSKSTAAGNNATVVATEAQVYAVQSNLTAHTGNVSNPHSVTKAQVGLGNVDNTSDVDKPVSTATNTALALKANIASPAFTGTPSAPTATAGTNTTQIATTAFVKTAVDTKQDKITATGNTNLLVAPTTAGGQPTTKPISDFAAAINRTITLTGDTTSTAITDTGGNLSIATTTAQANKLKTTRSIILDSTQTSSYGSFDGSANVTIGLGTTVDDEDANTTLMTIGIQSLKSIVNRFRANIKALFSYFTNGSANSAVKLATARTIAISGKATGTATSFDGSANISIPITALSQTASDYPTLNQSTTGNAATATKLATARTITTSGDVTATATSFDGSASITIPTTLASVTRSNTTSTASPAAGATFTAIDSITSDTKGRVTSVNTKTVTLPNAGSPGSGYLPLSGGEMTGTITNTLNSNTPIFDSLNQTARLFISNNDTAKLNGYPSILSSGGHELVLAEGQPGQLTITDAGLEITTLGDIEFITGASDGVKHDVIEKDYNNRPEFASRDNGSVIVKADMSTTLTDAAASNTLPSTSSETIYAKLQTLRNNVKYLLNQSGSSGVAFNPTILFPYKAIPSATLFGNTVAFTGTSTLSFSSMGTSSTEIQGRVRWRAIGEVEAPSAGTNSSFMDATSLYKGLLNGVITQVFSNTYASIDYELANSGSSVPVGTFTAYNYRTDSNTAGGGTIYIDVSGNLIATGAIISSTSVSAMVSIDIELPLIISNPVNASGVVSL